MLPILDAFLRSSFPKLYTNWTKFTLIGVIFAIGLAANTGYQEDFDAIAKVKAAKKLEEKERIAEEERHKLNA